MFTKEDMISFSNYCSGKPDPPSALFSKWITEIKNTTIHKDPAFTSPKLKMAISAVCSYIGVKISDVKSNSRKTDAVKARHIIIYIAVKHLKMTTTNAAKIFDQDHATSLHAIKRVKNDSSTDAVFRAEVESIEKIISKYI